MTKNQNLNLKKPLHRTLVPLLVLLGLSASCSSAFAWTVVYDPTNWIENLATAISSVASEQLQIEAAVRQEQELVNSIKNTGNSISSLSGISSITSANQTISSLLSQWNTDETLMSELGGESSFVSGVISQYAASSSSGTLTDYLAKLAADAAAGKENATSLFANYENMSTELVKTIKQRQAIAEQNTGALGTNDAIAVTNAQLDNVAEINQATLQGIQTLVRQAAYKQSTEIAATQNAETQRSTASTMGTNAAAGVSGVSTASSLVGY